MQRPIIYADSEELICLSCQTSSASFPCPYCHVPLREITSTVDDTAEDLPEDLWDERTFGNLKEFLDIYTTIYDCNRKFAKNSIAQLKLHI